MCNGPKNFEKHDKKRILQESNMKKSKFSYLWLILKQSFSLVDCSANLLERESIEGEAERNQQLFQMTLRGEHLHEATDEQVDVRLKVRIFALYRKWIFEFKEWRETL